MQQWKREECVQIVQYAKHAHGARALTSVFVAAAIVLRWRGHLALRVLWTAQEDCAIEAPDVPGIVVGPFLRTVQHTSMPCRLLSRNSAPTYQVAIAKRSAEIGLHVHVCTVHAHHAWIDLTRLSIARTCIQTRMYYSTCTN